MSLCLYEPRVDIIYENENVRNLEDVTDTIIEEIDKVQNKLAYLYNIDLYPPDIKQYYLKEYKEVINKLIENPNGNGFIRNEVDAITKYLIPSGVHLRDLMKNMCIGFAVFVFDTNRSKAEEYKYDLLAHISKEFNALFKFIGYKYNIACNDEFTLITIYPYLTTPRAITCEKLIHDMN